MWDEGRGTEDRGLGRQAMAFSSAGSRAEWGWLVSITIVTYIYISTSTAVAKEIPIPALLPRMPRLHTKCEYKVQIAHNSI